MKVEDLIATVRKLITETPDNVYKPDNTVGRCFYNSGECKNGSHGCVFGQAFRLLGEEVEDVSGGDPRDTGIVSIFWRMRIYFTPQQADWCHTVQSCQDNRQSWSKALEIADKTYPL